MSVTLIDDPSQFPAVTAPTNGDTFAAVRTGLQKCADRDANTKQRLDQGITRIRLGTVEQMRAINVATLSTGDVFLVPQQGPYLFDSASILAAAAPWVYTPLVGAGRWIIGLNALRGAAEGLSYLTAGRIADGQVKNQLVSTPFWWSSSLSQTITGGTGATNITGASISLGPLAVGDLVDVDMTFGDVQAVDIGSDIGVRISGAVPDQDVPGLGTMKIPKRFATNSAGTLSGSGRFAVTVAGTYTVRARGTAAAAADIIIAGNGSLRARVIRP